MRNLKKILALVLALVMSLSLMATASAGTFEDVPDDSPYKTATDVLNGLKVFKGYQDGSFQPEKTITRAEVATIIYRIATADVDDNQNKIYTTWQKFSDVKDTDWYAGYVNYCANAEYVKGHPNGTFTPQSEVTGYAVLAMILRTMGWDRNHEFEGSDWQIQTAAIARQEGLLNGITNATEAYLGQPAPRGMVAQILFNALLTQMVDYTVLAGYQPNGKTLGGEMFGLDSVSGVITANEWADLNGLKVLPADTTKMKVTAVKTGTAKIAVDDVITLSTTSALEDVGMNYTAYVADPAKTGAKTVLTLTPTYADQVIANNGKGTTVAALAGDAAKITADTEYYENYDIAWNEWATSKSLVRYAIAKDSVTTDWYNFLFDLEDYANDGEAVKGTVQERNLKVQTGVSMAGNPEYTEVDCYVRTIKPGEKITAVDQKIIQSIFFTADLVGNNVINNGELLVIGEVYVNTTSTKDVSDTMNWYDFCETYYDDTKEARKFTRCENGESLRLIDNNNDGKIEYALKVTYTQDKVVGTYKDAPLLNSLPVSKYTGNNLCCPEELTQGLVVNYTLIDGKLTVKPAKVVTDTVATKNFKDVTVTLTSGGDPYGQSKITNCTKLDDNIMLTDTQVEYNMYLDEFGYIRSYELAKGKNYALLTEMYPTGNYNGNYVSNQSAIVEMKVGEGDKVEKSVAGTTSGLFFSPFIWTFGQNYYFGVGDYNITARPNYLQPAIAHLGVDANLNRGVTNNTATLKIAAWDRAATLVALDNVNNRTGVFDYGAYPAGTYTALISSNGLAAPSGYKWDGNTGAADWSKHSFSFTNVAVYNEVGENAVSLNTVSKLAKNPNGDQLYRVGSGVSGTGTNLVVGLVGTEAELRAAYLKDNTVTGDDAAKTAAADLWWTTNYTLDSSKNGTKIYPVYEKDYVWLDLAKNLNGRDLAVTPGTRHYNINSQYGTWFNTNSNTYVDATVDTEFYIVMPGDIMYKVGYADLPNIKAEEIRAAYAVASNTAADRNGQDYWVADVIVIECSRLTYDYDSISLMYSNNYETYGFTRVISSLNNQWSALQTTDKAKLNVVPKATLNTGVMSWGNSPWADADYGFYKLYNTDQAEPDFLNVAEIDRILNGFNNYGIYAGTITRIQDLQKSKYMDVSTQKTGSGFDNLIDINYGDADQVPFYRISAPSTATSGTFYSAVELDVNAVEAYSGVHVGDQIIWVYDKAQNELAFIVDVTQSTDNVNAYPWNTAKAAGDRGYTTPTWLGNLYTAIINDQNNGSQTNGWKVTFVTDLPAGSKQPVATLTTYVVPKDNAASSTSTFEVPQASFALDGYVATTTADFFVNGSAMTTLTPNKNVATASSNFKFTVDGNTTILVKYTADTYDLTITPSTDSGDATITYSGVGTVATNSITGMKMGETFTVNFQAADADYTYKYTMTGGVETPVSTDADLPATGITGKVSGTGDITIAITQSARTKYTTTLDPTDANAPTGLKYSFKTTEDAGLTTTQALGPDLNGNETFTVTATQAFFVYDGTQYIAYSSLDAATGKATFTGTLKDYDTKTLTFVKAITIEATNNVSGASSVSWSYEDNGITGWTPVLKAVKNTCVIPAGVKMIFSAVSSDPSGALDLALSGDDTSTGTTQVVTAALTADGTIVVQNDYS